MAKGAKTGGRKRGTPNKITGDVRAAILTAFEGAGGADYLRTVAAERPEVFCGLLGRIIPKQVEMDAEVELIGRLVWGSPEKS